MTATLPVPGHGVKDRAASLRTQLHASREGQEVIASLAPQSMFHGDRDMVDFSDWSQFSQWPQSV